jgi:hypothetical protein
MYRVRLDFSMLGLAVLLWAASSFAAIVAIVRPRNPPALMTETLGRISGELASAGFTTEIVDEPFVDGAAHQPARAWLEQLATRRGFDAVVAILGDGSADSVEVWVVDKVTGKTVVRTVRLGLADERMPTTVSVRAIELLRSSFAEIDLRTTDLPGSPSTVPSPVVVQFVQKGRQANRPERFGLELGGIATMGFDRVGPALLPFAALDWAIDSSFGAQATLAGLGTRPTVASQEGSAQIAQAFGLLGMRYSLGAFRLMRPFLVLSAGALHTDVEGRTDIAVNQERQTDKWSFLLDAGLGTWLQLRDRLFVSTSLHAQVGEPRLAIRFVDQVVAGSGGPNVLVNLSVGAWL